MLYVHTQIRNVQLQHEQKQPTQTVITQHSNEHSW